MILALLILLSMPAQPHRHEACPGAMYFHSGKPSPAWIKGKREACRIGRITFYTDKRKSK